MEAFTTVSSCFAQLLSVSAKHCLCCSRLTRFSLGATLNRPQAGETFQWFVLKQGKLFPFGYPEGSQNSATLASMYNRSLLIKHCLVVLCLFFPECICASKELGIVLSSNYYCGTQLSCFSPSWAYQTSDFSDFTSFLEVNSSVPFAPLVPQTCRNFIKIMKKHRISLFFYLYCHENSNSKSMFIVALLILP